MFISECSFQSERETGRNARELTDTELSSGCTGNSFRILLVRHRVQQVAEVVSLSGEAEALSTNLVGNIAVELIAQ